MNKEVLDYVVAKTNDLLKAATITDELSKAAQAWLDALGTQREVEENKKYIQALEENIVPIDDLIQMAESKEGIQYFGAETAGNIGSHAKDIKSAGATYCDCPACSAAEAILAKKDAILK